LHSSPDPLPRCFHSQVFLASPLPPSCMRMMQISAAALHFMCTMTRLPSSEPTVGLSRHRRRQPCPRRHSLASGFHMGKEARTVTISVFAFEPFAHSSRLREAGRYDKSHSRASSASVTRRCGHCALALTRSERSARPSLRDSISDARTASGCPLRISPRGRSWRVYKLSESGARAACGHAIAPVHCTV
jgi:hypothetical protein